MFRVTAGLPSPATPCGGWESPSTELRGHSLGHVLTALAQAWADTGETAFRIEAWRSFAGHLDAALRLAAGDL